MMGGAGISVPNNVPTNITLTHNYLTKRLIWDDNDPTFAGVHMDVKNDFELKVGANVTVDQNILENVWVGADQKAFAIELTPRDSSGNNNTNTWVDVTYVTFTNNVIRHTGAGVNILGNDLTANHPLELHDVVFRNNVFYDLGGPEWGYEGFGANGIGFQFVPGDGGGIGHNVTIDHNVLFETYDFIAFSGSIGTPTINNLTFTNNIILHGEYGLHGDSEGEGIVSFEQLCPWYRLLHRQYVIVGFTGNTTVYPTGNFFPATQDAVGFKDTQGLAFGLLSTSAYHNAATDGTDIGVIMANLDPEFVPIDSTLTGYWKLDEGTGTTTADSSGSGKTATLSSSTLWTTSGLENKAVALTGGTSGSLSVPTFSTTSSYTFAAWIKPAAFSATQYIASTANNAFSLYVNSSGDLVATGKTGTVTDTTALTAGKWYLVAVTFDGATLTLYKNGVSVGTPAAATTATGSTTLYLGGNGGSVSSFNGTIDEARYYNSNIASQLATLYSNYAPQWEDYFTSPITTTTTGLSVTVAIGHEGTSGFIYTFATVSQPAGVPAPTFSNNGTTTASTTVTFYGAGNYIFSFTDTDSLGAPTTYNSGIISVTTSFLPAAPSNLVATPGTSSTVLTWTDNSTNETGFHVYRSTDNATWGTALASTAANATTYTDSTPAAGTAYYYKVNSFNASGDSTVTGARQNDITCAVATVIAYDGFNYAAGNGNNLAGHNTGVGFNANWATSDTTNTTILSGSLTYSASGHALTTSGNSVQVGCTRSPPPPAP